MEKLTELQRKSFLKYFDDYKKWKNTKEGEENSKEHREHHEYFKKQLSKKTIEEISENGFREIYKKLWSSRIWKNKDWYVENKLLKPNKSLNFIKSELSRLFYSDEQLMPKRYNEFKNNIKGFGSSAITELLHFVFPGKYCLWNDKPKTVLPFIGIGSLLPDKFYKSQIAEGEEYAQCNEVMGLLRKELEKAGIKDADFIDLDCYIWYIFITYLPKKNKSKPEEIYKEDETVLLKEDNYVIETHEDAEYFVLKLGEMLGYSTYTCDKKEKYHDIELGDVALLKELPDFAGERDKGFARRIDVIWFDADENPKYCIEVEHTTNVVNSLTKLYQLKQFHVDFFIVASEDKRSKYESEMGKSPYRADKDRFHFISYNDLISLFDTGSKFHILKNKLFGD